MGLATPARHPPNWVADAVVYQVFPDRFRRSGRVPAQQDLALLAWGSDPADQGFQGGDLLGVIEALDHLQGLGVTCLSLNPVFASAANHRYHTWDYLQVDPLLGGNAALEALIAAVHGRGMRLILDGVFNHCSRGFWAFHHLVENGWRSPYRDWFHVQDWSLQPYPDDGQACRYACWWNDPALPKFNHAHPGVKRHLLKVARHWLAAGIDGWRLDVPDEVPPDFWEAFRTAVHQVNPEAWIVGEIWGDARPWLGEGTKAPLFDGVMNYPLAWPILGYFGAANLRTELRLPAVPKPPYEALDRASFQGRVEDILNRYSDRVTCAQLNLLDSHDTPRALHALGGDRQALGLSLLFLFLLPGAPCIYYGTEQGLEGGAEPACREAYPWEQPAGDLHELLQTLTALRSAHPALRTRELRFLPSPDDDLLILERSAESEHLWIAINRGGQPMAVDPPQGLGNQLWPAVAMGIPERAAVEIPGQSARIHLWNSLS